MTLKQRAYSMIDTMSEEELRAWIFLVGGRQKSEEQRAAEQRAKEKRAAEKKAAIEELFAIRDRIKNVFPPNFDPEQELIAALEEKHGPVN